MIFSKNLIDSSSCVLTVALACLIFECARAQQTSNIDKNKSHLKPITRNQQGTSKKMAALDNLVTESVIPDVIDSKPAAEIQVSYDSGVKVNQGAELTPTQVKDLPKFSYNAKPGKLYTLAMVDPDAPSRKEPKLREILHFLAANIPGNDVAKGDTLAEYIGSGPPKGTGLHRYIFLLYEQPSKMTSATHISKFSRNGRISFSIRKWAKENNLGEPVAANFYQAQYDDYVPILHAQLSKEQ